MSQGTYTVIRTVSPSHIDVSGARFSCVGAGENASSGSTDFGMDTRRTRPGRRTVSVTEIEPQLRAKELEGRPPLGVLHGWGLVQDRAEMRSVGLQLSTGDPVTSGRAASVGLAAAGTTSSEETGCSSSSRWLAPPRSGG
jgi:hypothetical protein